MNKSLQLNVFDIFDQAVLASRIQMKPAEKQQFFDKHINNMRLVIDEKGDVSIKLNT